jgi:hypothetical protein
VPGEVALGDHAPEGLGDDDGPLDAQHVAQAHQVVGPDVEGPVGLVAGVAPAVAAVVVLDDLGDVGQVGERLGLEQRVVQPGTAVEPDHGRPLDHLRAVRDQPVPVDVDEQPDPAADVDPHGSRV